MKQWKLAQKLAFSVYGIGVLCVLVLGEGYLGHSEVVANPDAMLPMTEYESCVILLLFGLPFLLAACVMVCILFPDWRRSAKICVFLPLLLAVGIVGYDFGTEALTPQEPETRFQVEAVLNTECDIYAVSGDLYLDGEVIGGETCCEAGGQPLKRGETIYLAVYPENVPKGRRLSDLTMAVSLMTEAPDHGTQYKVKNGTVTATKYGERVTLTIIGDVENGFEAETGD